MATDSSIPDFCCMHGGIQQIDILQTAKGDAATTTA